MRRGLISIITLICIFLSITGISKIEITHSPLKPKAGDTVNFYVNLDGNVSSVKLWIEECKDNQCFIPEILDMEQTGSENYTAKYQLREDTTLVHYKINIAYKNGSYYETDLYEFEVEPQTQANPVVNEKKTPGFEMYLVILSGVLIILISRRLSR